MAVKEGSEVTQAGLTFTVREDRKTRANDGTDACPPQPASIS